MVLFLFISLVCSIFIYIFVYKVSKDFSISKLKTEKDLISGKYHFKIRTMKHIFYTILLALCCTQLPRSCDNEGKKYIAYSTDTEAYFMPRDFEHFQGEFTGQIVDVCREANIPFTWLIVVDKEHSEVSKFSEKVFPIRREVDEFSLHAPFKWFIMDTPDDCVP